MERVVIDRWECSWLRRSSGWLLVYGRRKTGKTWLLTRCLDWTVYATVGASGVCLVTRRGEPGIGEATLGDCVREVLSAASRAGGVAVIDEFQRLPTRYWDTIAAAAATAEGRLVLCGSSMAVASKVFDRRSPLLGLLKPFHVDIASLPDTIASLHAAGLDPRSAVLWAVVARDPWLLRHASPRGEPWRVLAAEAPRLVPAARSLVGEVFEEEERQLTRLYDAILHLLAEGYWRTGELAQKLYEQGLTARPDPATVTAYLDNLARMGLVEKLPLWRTRGARRLYRHRSSLTAILYSVADIVEEIPAQPSVEAVRSRYALELQFNTAELLAEWKGLRRAYSIPPGEPDIDIVLLDHRGRPQWGYEVKLGEIARGEAEKAVETMRRLGIPRTGLVSLAAKPPTIADEALTAEDLVEVALRLSEEHRKNPPSAA